MFHDCEQRPYKKDRGYEKIFKMLGIFVFLGESSACYKYYFIFYTMPKTIKIKALMVLTE